MKIRMELYIPDEIQLFSQFLTALADLRARTRSLPQTVGVMAGASAAELTAKSMQAAELMAKSMQAQGYNPLGPGAQTAVRQPQHSGAGNFRLLRDVAG